MIVTGVASRGARTALTALQGRLAAASVWKSTPARQPWISAERILQVVPTGHAVRNSARASTAPHDYAALLTCAESAEFTIQCRERTRPGCKPLGDDRPCIG